MQCPDPCSRTADLNNTVYVCGDSRLGPRKLPEKFPLSTELATYARFGNLCPNDFLKKWTNSSTGAYIYPMYDGFLLTTDNHTINGSVTLPVGMKLDRFGSEFGNFLGPLGAPYLERALPPSNLNTPDGGIYPYNYHVYQVTKVFAVSAGPIRAWFEQPGQGTQYVTNSSVGDLVAGGYLKRLHANEYNEKSEFADNYTPGPSKTRRAKLRHY